jgi:hypothetical protein
MIDRSEMRSSRLHRLLDLWISGRTPDGRPMPREAFDPLDVPRLLSGILLLEVVDGGRDIVFRVAGDEVESRYGRSLNGRSISETFPLVQRGDTSHQWQEIVEDALPKYRRGPMSFPGSRAFMAERLIVPLSAGPIDVAFILGFVGYLPMPPRDFEAVAVAGTIAV